MKGGPNFFVFLPSLLLVTGSSSTQAPSTLKFVQILFRHGDRNPNRPWGPQDPNPESAWPQGWGQLTNLGKAQLYQLGEQTRHRYAKFLSREYKYALVVIGHTSHGHTTGNKNCLPILLQKVINVVVLRIGMRLFHFGFPPSFLPQE